MFLRKTLKVRVLQPSDAMHLADVLNERRLALSRSTLDNDLVDQSSLEVSKEGV